MRKLALRIWGWVKELSPSARERAIDIIVLHDTIDRMADSPEQAAAAKRIHWILENGGRQRGNKNYGGG